MEYLEAVKLLKEIEQKYDVMSIKYKGVSVWPQLRIYMMSELATHSEQGLSSSSVKLVISTLFYYNPLSFFKKFDIWHFCSCITRKKVGGKYVHHVSGMVSKLGYKSLQWEYPIPGVRHYPKKDIEEREIVSASWWLLFSRGLAILGKWKKVNIENEDLIKRILSDYQLYFDYKACVNRLIWLKKTADLFLTIGQKPKLIVMECAYTQMGTVWSAHEHGIPVVELQHGVLNAFHYGYNPTYHSAELYPDEICVYGDVEYDYFINNSKQYASRVSIMGMYMLECADKTFNKDLFAEYRGKYEKVVVVAGETGLEDMLSKFVDEVATKLPNVMFMYLPRRSEPGLSFKAENVKYCFGVNIYEYLKWCDVHCTITSTTCLESHYFHKPTIFLNYEGRSRSYYGDVLSEEYGGFYVDNPEEFVKAYKGLETADIKFKEIFAHQHEERLHYIIDVFFLNS